MRRRLKFGFISALAMLLVVLTGCQAVGGVDLNKVLTDNMGITSYEGTADLEIEIVLKEGADIPEEAVALVHALNNFSLTFHDVKVQDLMTMSMEGKIQVLNEEIPFTMTMDENEVAVLIDGAKKPIVFPQTFEDENVPAELAELLSGKAFTEDMVDLVISVGEFFIKHFPNPASVTVDDVTENINGQHVALKKIEIELDGKQLPSLIQTFLKGMLEDEEGLNETLSKLYDVYAPILTQVLKATAEETEGLDEILPYLENKQLAVGFLYTAIQTNLAPIVEDFDNQLHEWIGEDAYAAVFNENNVLTTAMYIDEDGVVRKQDFALTLNLNLDEVETIVIRSTSEYWNVNGTVKANLLDTTDALVVNENVTEEDFKQLFEEDSLIYQWISQLESLIPTPEFTQFVMLDMSGNTTLPGYEQQPYIKNGTTMVPVRYVSEELLADVSWNAATREVTIVDSISDVNIVLAVGSNSAAVNGQSVTLDAAAELQSGSVFVPVRFIAEALGAEVIWDSEAKIIIITR